MYSLMDSLINFISGEEWGRLLCGTLAFFLAVWLCRVYIFIKRSWDNKIKSKYSWTSLGHLCFGDLFSAFAIFTVITFAVIICLFVLDLNTFHTNFSKFISTSIALALCKAFIDQTHGDSEVQLNEFEKDTESIGAFWATSSYRSYYQIVLKDILSRIQAFEEKYKITISLKSLVLLLPLSCNVEGRFGGVEKKEENMEYIGILEPIQNDQGANVNRNYKNPVYKIIHQYCDPLYIVVESPNPLLAIWNMKDDDRRYPENYRTYIRDTYIKALTNLLKDSPCTTLVYDDRYPRKKKLAEFLHEEISKKVVESVDVEFLERKPEILDST